MPPRLKLAQIPHTKPECLSPEKETEISARIKKLLIKQQAVLVAHYYTSPALQRLADETSGCISDSLDMARFGRRSGAKKLLVCGVRFMGETAKILNPEKKILMPDLEANCSLDIGCPVDEFTRFCRAHPDRTVVVYANTSAAIKAKADWMVTSGSAVDVVRYLTKRGEKILWAPDKYLGQYVQQQTGADMLLWQGSCVVHEEFKGKELCALKKQHPEAKILAHPESPAAVLALADFVGSTTALIAAAQRLDANKLIVATDKGIFYKMHQLAPNKTLIEAPTAGKGASCVSCAHCPWMAMNSLTKLEHALENDSNEVHVDHAICNDAIRPIERLLDFTTDKKKLAGDA